MTQQATPKIENISPDELAKLRTHNAVQAHNSNLLPDENADDKRQKYKPTSRFEPLPFDIVVPSGNLALPEFMYDEAEGLKTVKAKVISVVQEDKVLTFFRDLYRDLTNNQGSDATALIELYQDKFFHIIDTIIDDCLKTNVSIEDFMVVDRMWLFISIIANSYGPEQILEYQCPICSTKNNIKTHLIKDLKDLKIYGRDIKTPYPLKYVFDIDGIEGPKQIQLIMEYPKIKDFSLLLKQDVFSQVGLLSNVLIEAQETVNGVPKLIDKTEFYDVIQAIPLNARLEIKKIFDDFTLLGTQLEVKKKVCTNKTCENFNKLITTEIPINSLFNVVFKMNV